jgi:membrane carboxypeptidase/penicillin-binding protein
MRILMKRVVLSLFVAALASQPMMYADSTTTTHHSVRHTRGHVHETAAAHRRVASLQHSVRVTGAHVASATLTTAHGAHAVYLRHATLRHHYYERFTASSFASTDLTSGDITAGEDPVVRQAAINALGDMNGTVVAIDPSNGRILAMVNQKLALSSGAEPCSTIKLSVALAALEEGIINRDTPVNLGGSYHLNLTEALAHSNNLYFETVGRRLGFERVRHYATEFGLGELAGYEIPGEKPGLYPDEPLPENLGGVGRMCSFGEGISMTPLQLGALVAAISNGGTLYYLQHPTSPEAVADFQPVIKRHLDIANAIPELSDGMAGAVAYGTARSLRLNFNEESILGKTGTCSHAGTRFGWFASYANTDIGRIVTVVFLQGGRPTFGPKAAEITGRMYRNLYDHNFFVAGASGITTAPSLEKVTTSAAPQE